MDRKEFIKKTSCGVCVAMTSGFLMSALLDSCKTPLSVVKTTAKDDVITIPLSEFEKSDYKLVRVANYNYDLAVQKKKDGTYETLVLMCTHAGQPLTKTGGTYYCTLHGSVFDHEGHVTKGPAEKDLMKLKTKIFKNQLTIQFKTNVMKKKFFYLPLPAVPYFPVATKMIIILRLPRLQRVLC